MYSKVLLFGATRAAGFLFAKVALDKGLSLTLYIRNPDKLHPFLASHDKVTIVVGEMSDGAKLLQAIRTGVDSVVLLVGGDTATKGTPLLDGVKILYPLLISEGVKRVITLSTPSYVDPQDKGTFLFWLGPRVLWYLARDQQVQVIGLASFTVAQSTKLEWTVVRIPMLTDLHSKPVHAGYTGDKKGTMKLSRQSLAEWCLEELQAGKWIGKAPFLSNV